MKWNCLNSCCQRIHLAKYMEMSHTGILKVIRNLLKVCSHIGLKGTYSERNWRCFHEPLEIHCCDESYSMLFLGYFGFPNVLCCYLSWVRNWSFHLSYFLCYLTWECYKTYFYLLYEKIHLPVYTCFWQNISLTCTLYTNNQI